MTLRLNDPQTRLEGFFPEFEHEPVSSFQEALAILNAKSGFSASEGAQPRYIGDTRGVDAYQPDGGNTVRKGSLFEQLVKAFIETDKAQSERFDRVWLWSEYPGRNGRPDIGIDLVAKEKDGGGFVAIQCKFYAPDKRISKDDIKSFVTAATTTEFAGGIFVSTTANWTRNVEDLLANRGDRPIVRWGPDTFEKSSIDWKEFSLTRPSVLAKNTGKRLRDYQQQALEDTLSGFEENERGKLIMACGSGKTFTALRIAERLVGTGGSVLFLTPSISLLSQSLIDWANDAETPLKALAVCSDPRAGRRRAGDEDMSPYDLSEPASTDWATLVSRFGRVDRSNYMTAVFSTYQSLDVVSEAQAQDKGLPEFDLIICDEAHRTTGASLTTDKAESGFRRIHDGDFIKGDKRLYMTATPRIYSDRAKRKANETNLTNPIASMDDKKLYGPEFHRLGFGRAVDMGILTPYKVVILDVDMQKAAIDLDDFLSAENTEEINMDDASRMVGCWNGLQKRGSYFPQDDLQPVKRAVAFSNQINQSKLFKTWFPEVAGLGDYTDGSASVRHVDGKQNALERAGHLAWLRDEPEPGECKILTNARCLTEGIDVPDLDAILFLHPRNSEIDVVQAVGRVMRKAEGKKFGYIVIPIANAPDVSPEVALRSGNYRAVWQIINALMAHDDRFEATVNQLALERSVKPKSIDIGNSGGDSNGTGGGEEGEQGELEALILECDKEMADAILSRVVDKYADPQYWAKWAQTIQKIAAGYEARIRGMLDNPRFGVRRQFAAFHSGIKQNLNSDVAEDDAIRMLSQHLITKPVFDAVFGDYPFTQRNPVSVAMQGMIDVLEGRGLDRETESLDNFYYDVRQKVRGITDLAAKQRVIAQLYEQFFKLATPETARLLGIVYTPVEVVDWIVRSVEDVLNRDFEASLSDEGVNVLDPFVGTGTFITRLIQSGIVSPNDLPRKYANELHASELNLLAYYIAASNIETTYHDAIDADRYQPFANIALTDTFEQYENSASQTSRFPELADNSERIRRQKDLDIRVIMGNPPWSSTNNRAYPFVDGRIAQAYRSARRKNALRDPYVRSIRLASDRIQEGENGGIVAFVTNGGFIDSNSFDGFRKAVANEFDTIYCYNLRGDARTSGERRQREGGGVFDSGSRAGVAILLLIKRGASEVATKRQPANIYYRDIGDYLDRDAKLDILRESRLSNTDWQTITPDQHHDWIDQRNAAFLELRPLAPPAPNAKDDGMVPIFEAQTLGLVTSRDAWCFSSSKCQLRSNIERSVAFYNTKVSEFQEIELTGSITQRAAEARNAIGKTPQDFHWSRENYRDLANGVRYSVSDANFRMATYRPFFKQHLFFKRELNNSIRDFPEIYPEPDADNLGIAVTREGTNDLLYALATSSIPDYHLTGDSAYIPRYRYVSSEAALRRGDGASKRRRVSNINRVAVQEFRKRYSNARISADDLFYYTYGVLHSQQWRETFAADLAKSPARIPMASSLADFRAFAKAGRELADLHVNYESVDPYPLDEIHADGWNANSENAYRVEKMRYAGNARNPDRTRILYNAGVTLAGIPDKAQEYRLGSRSALDWLIDRYRVTTHKASGITNDPNDWCAEVGDPRYILDLIKRVTTVSVRTVDIMNGLPELPI